MINLPIDNDHWPLFRVLTAPRFSNGAGPWTVQPMRRAQDNGFGFFVESISRACLPAVGEAVLSYDFGLIDRNIVGARLASDTRVASGSPWDPARDTATAPDLHFYEIRIQVAPFVADGGTPAWRTVWLGQCEMQTDAAWPGAIYPAGRRTYHCADGLARTKRWFMNRHGAYSIGATYDNVYGHPGYNSGLDGLTIGNRDSTGAGYNPQEDCKDNKTYYHTFQGTTTVALGTATVWTDLQACEHALRATRPLGEPLLSFVGDTSLLSAIALPWPVDEGETVFDFLTRVCKRERGRGTVFYDWTDDTSDPTGTIVPKLTIYGQYGSSYIGVSDPTTNPPTPITVAASSSTITVDLLGDHRNVTSSFQLSDSGQWRADAVETAGNPIEVLATLSYYDGSYSIAKSWDSSIEATFAALSPLARSDDSWRFVWTLHRLPLDWQGLLGDGNGSLVGRGDYSCNDAGVIGFALKTSPLLTKVMPDLPLYEGYLYNGSVPTRRDNTTPVGKPQRRPPLMLLRTASDRYINGSEVGLTMNVQPTGFQVYGAGIDDGIRIIGDTANGAAYALSVFAVTVGLQMPHRIRMRTLRAGVNEDQARRIRRIEHPELHLWLAHSGAIWDRNCAPYVTSSAEGRRAALGGTATSPGLLRDDRAKLAQLHALACAWYLQDRRSCTWALKACGFLPSFNNTTDSTTSPPTVVAINYPTIGQLVTTLSASGQAFTLNTPITFVTYDNRTGVTQWQTDWQDKDFV